MAAKASSAVLYESSDSYEELYGWLECNGISVAKLEADFIDGIECAVLLARAFPKIQEMPLREQRTLEGRVDNWRMLSAKGLSKLGLTLDQSFIKKLSTGSPGTIQSLLLQIMEAYKAKQPLDLTDDIMLSLEESDIFVAKIPMLLGKTKIRAKRKMVKAEKYVTLMKEMQIKEKYLYVLVANVQNMLNKLKKLGPLCGRDRKKLKHMIYEFNSMIPEESDETEDPDESDVEGCYQESHNEVRRIKKYSPAKQDQMVRPNKSATARAEIYRRTTESDGHKQIEAKEEVQRKHAKYAKDYNRKDKTEKVQLNVTKSAEFARPLVQNHNRRRAQSRR